jgi:hypothetical protein
MRQRPIGWGAFPNAAIRFPIQIVALQIKTVTAGRVRSNIEITLGYAKARGYRPEGLANLVRPKA